MCIIITEAPVCLAHSLTSSHSAHHWFVFAPALACVFELTTLQVFSRYVTNRAVFCFFSDRVASKQLCLFLLGAAH